MNHSYGIQYKRAMALFNHLGLVSLAMLMLVSQLDFTSAAVRVFGLHASSLYGDPAGNDPDPYVKVWCGSHFGGMSEFQRDVANPSWSAEFNFLNCKANQDLKFEVWDKDLIYDDHLGTCVRQVQKGTFTGNCHLDNGILFYSFEAK
ncbi:perforin-1-like [Carassius auratus]|uniref:Perforin-1-like n=1 Tax=Carassius auratus TaxID=7957 RepID=A0A6P6JZB9_CARAU|nr:perforin-1-like [Carassius auratus]